ncbi:hypothetical protein LIER_19486 [Lithospermum erythrorhizon]|uniref:Uncharacterized protein n=1 Tax=Lithospermum erythrorhizon TaxID=34254 RepID=A0AAV3QK93_LITER
MLRANHYTSVNRLYFRLNNKERLSPRANHSQALSQDISINFQRIRSIRVALTQSLQEQRFHRMENLKEGNDGGGIPLLGGPESSEAVRARFSFPEDQPRQEASSQQEKRKVALGLSPRREEKRRKDLVRRRRHRVGRQVRRCNGARRGSRFLRDIHLLEVDGPLPLHLLQRHDVRKEDVKQDPSYKRKRQGSVYGAHEINKS